MELHQIRYCLALSKTLNFTRAAEECNVSQPALSRAISQLESELGGELFRRERSLTHVTELGQTVLPALRQCYEANANAKLLAKEFLKGGHAPLNIALSRSIEMDFLSPLLSELATAFPNIEIRVFRGPPHEIVERLRNGESELAIAGPLGGEWERLEASKLYEQRFGLLLSRDHRLSHQNAIELLDLFEERMLSRPYCMMTETLLKKLKELGASKISKHEVPSIEDFPDLVQAHFGVGIWPLSRRLNGDLLVQQLNGMDLIRWIQVYTVFGRRHSVAATTLTSLLRAMDWSAVMPLRTASAEVAH
jgi:DNA-binding transcriptional LysR family regulator